MNNYESFDKARPVTAEEQADMAKWGIEPPQHNGRDVVDVKRNVVSNATYKPLPVLGGNTRSSK